VASLSLICSRDTPFPAFAQTARDLRAGAATDVDAARERWFRPDEREIGGWLVSYARDCLVNVDRRTWAIALDGIARYDRSDAIGQIEAPATLICAELDPVSSPEAMGALAARLPNARLHILRGAAHLSPLLRPTVLAAQLGEGS
jgi:pimeloyl-ACP methyl ester carboxylesterase